MSNAFLGTYLISGKCLFYFGEELASFLMSTLITRKSNVE